VFWQDTNILENFTASIFRVKCVNVWCWEVDLGTDAGSMRGNEVYEVPRMILLHNLKGAI